MRPHPSVGLRRRAAAALFLLKPKVATMSQANGLFPLGGRCRSALCRVACVVLVFFVVSERRVQADPPAIIAPPPGPEDSCVVEHTVVYDEPGRYAGWPANGGAWVWGNELAVAFECGWFKDRPDEADGHARDTDRSNEDIVARSRDGGRTWSHEVHNLLSSDDNMTESPGGLDWAHPGFAFKCQGERFYYSYDRAQTWKGPHRLRIPGLMGGDDDLESRTAYIVNGSRDAFLFLGVEPKGGQDLAFVTQTTNGGKTFDFVGWISPNLNDAPKDERWAVYSGIRTTDGRLLAALRRKISRRSGAVKRLNWIDVYESRDDGRSWKFLSKVADTSAVNSDFNGNPPSLLQLRDGRLAVTYGFRAKPYVLCAKLSQDGGRSWSAPVILRNGARNWDFGYSRSLEREDGKVVTLYYWATPEHRNQFLAATIWDPARIGEDKFLLRGVPVAARLTIEGLVADGKLTDVDREEDDDEILFEVEIDRDGRDFEFEVADSGQLLKEEVLVSALDPAVRKTLEDFAGAGRVTKVEREWDDGEWEIQAEVERDDREFEIELSASGQILDVDEDEDDDDDDNPRPDEIDVDQLPLGAANLTPDFELVGAGKVVDTIAFWEADDPNEVLMFVTAKGNSLVEVWKYPFKDNELPAIRHESFGSSQVNGVAVDQETDLLYIVTGSPAATVSVFELPSLAFRFQFIEGSADLGEEPNLCLLKRPDGETWAYVSGEDAVFIHDAKDGKKLGEIQVDMDVETVIADDHHQIVYIPDERGTTGIHAYTPEGKPYLKGGQSSFADGSIIQRDAEGIWIYGARPGEKDDGKGFIILSDQRQDHSDFEFFDRETWKHLGVLRLDGVDTTDGIASTRLPMEKYPQGLFVAIHRDLSTVGIRWETVLEAFGLLEQAR